MQYLSEIVCLVVEFLLYWVKIIADFCPQIDIFKGNCWIRCFTNLFPQFCPRNFSQFEQLKKKEKILLVQNIFHKFRIPNIRIFLFQLTNLELSKEQIHKVSTNIFPTTRLISSRVTKKHMTQTGTYLLVVLFCILKRERGHEPTKEEIP